MKNYSKKNILETIILILLIGVFAIFYWQTIMVLPLFGDATIHGSYAKELLLGGWKTLDADYPPFYYYIMAIFYSFLGEKGFNLVPFIGFVFLLFSVFLFIRQLTKNYYAGLFSVVLVAVSPKIIYYSARMYQEILISAFFIFSIFCMFKYIENKSWKNLFIFSIFTGFTLSIKQQGLFIMYSSVVIYFILDFLRKKIKINHLLAIVLLPILLGLPFYGILFHTKGEIQPGSGEFKLFKIINSIGQKIFFYTPSSLRPQTDEINYNLFIQPVFAENNVYSKSTLNKELQIINENYSYRAYSRAESRHIWPTEVLTNFDKFNQANNLYLLNWQGKKLESPFVFYFLFSSLVLGFIYCILKYKSYSELIIFTLIFLTINYILFARNNDQQRYHIFIPIFILGYVCIFLTTILKRITINYSLKHLSVIILSTIAFSPILIQRIELNTLWNNTQLYSPSVGGIKSVQDTGNWISSHTDTSTILGQECGNETHYYADRSVVGDWRIYFLNRDSLSVYFKKEHISYYVINQSQLVKDKEWAHICWVPESFYHLMESNYKKIYESAKKDIYVYEIT